MAITFNRSAIARRPWSALRHLPFLAQWAGQRLFRRLTARWRTLPDFVIIGAQRCGTTSLYNYLVDHPGVATAFMKETHFFDLHFSKGLGWYRAHFPLVSTGRRVAGPPRPLVGEATPYYLFYPHAAPRLRAALPDAKLMVLLRNPVDRAYSHYHHEVSMGVETLSFEEALSREESVLPAETARITADGRYRSFAHFHGSYLARGIYIDQLVPWIHSSPPDAVRQGWGCTLTNDNLMIIRSESFYADPAAVVRQVFAFLGLPAWTSGTYKKYNLAHYDGMNPATRERLAAFYRPHNQRLYEAFGMDLGLDG